MIIALLTSRLATCLAAARLAALLSVVASSAQAAGPVLKWQGRCTFNSSDVCLSFSSEQLPPKVVRALDFNAPGPGTALVSAMGSGHCRNAHPGGSTFIRFVTQIVNNPNAVATYAGPGGNRFRFTLLGHDGANNDGIGSFNLASERVFGIGAAGVQHYSLNINVPAISIHYVSCDVDSVALTVLFLPK